MNKSEQLRERIAALQAQIAPLARQLDGLRRDYSKACSQEFIASNGITRADVEFIDDKKIYFHTAARWAQWLLDNSSKNWAEWNTVIYRTSDLINHRMPDMPGRTEDLP